MTEAPEQRGAPAALRMTASLYVAIVDHLAAAQPNEGVGLVATRFEGDVARAVKFFPGTNLDCSPTRYTMDPAEVLAAIREMGASGWTLGAIAHSHVSSAPTPSATDLREAYYPDALLMIVGFGAGAVKARVWRVVSVAQETRVIEVPLLVDRA